jgi:fimbrial chaperone protein
VKAWPQILSAGLVLSLAHASTLSAAEFAALVSPPRFEVQSRAGVTVRQVFELTNRSPAPAKYRVHTADFSLGADYTVSFQDQLQPGSCRPWVAIERPAVELPGGATIRYRFEVQVPKDAPVGECRFGILIEADEPSLARSGPLELPIVGRIGIIVYLIVGDAKPQLEVFGPKVVTLNQQRIPALRVHNSGNAHTRLSGFLTGIDAKGAKYDFSPSDLPVLPGEARDVFLTPSTAGNEHPVLAFPVTVHGTLEWANEKTELDERFE